MYLRRLIVHGNYSQSLKWQDILFHSRLQFSFCIPRIVQPYRAEWVFSTVHWVSEPDGQYLTEHNLATWPVHSAHSGRSFSSQTTLKLWLSQSILQLDNMRAQEHLHSLFGKLTFKLVCAAFCFGFSGMSRGKFPFSHERK